MKLAKAPAPKYGGEPAEWAAFISDFYSLVVPGRSPEEIGWLLRDAISKEHVHLIANVELKDWKEMDMLLTMMAICNGITGKEKKMATCIIMLNPEMNWH